MDTKSRNSKIVKMDQNDGKINLDSIETKTQLNKIKIKIDIVALRTFRTACKMQQKNVKEL